MTKLNGRTTVIQGLASLVVLVLGGATGYLWLRVDGNRDGMIVNTVRIEGIQVTLKSMDEKLDKLIER